MNSVPHQNINKYFMFLIGLWPHQNGFSKYTLLFITLFFMTSQSYLQMGGMIAAREDMDVLMESIPPVLVDFVVGAKIVNFISNFEKMKKLLVLLEADWEKFKGCHEIKIMRGYAIVARRLTLSYAGWMYATMMPFMIIPLMPIIINTFGSINETNAKQLMFRVDFLLDTETYYYPLLIHSYFGTLTFITVVVAIDTLLLTYVQHACGCFAVLGYSNLIESANYKSCFFQLIINMVVISFTGFQAVMQLDRPELAIRYAAFTLSQMILLFLQSYPGQLLYDSSTQVATDVNNCNWYYTSIRTRKLIGLMTLRSRIPSSLTAGKFYVLNMANFSSVLRKSMSYLTVLTSAQ